MQYGHLFEGIGEESTLGKKAYDKIAPDFIHYINSVQIEFPKGFKKEDDAKEFIANIKLILKASFLLEAPNLSLPKLSWDTNEWMIDAIDKYDEGLANLFKKMQKK